jgi:hypothetical protein
MKPNSPAPSLCWAFSTPRSVAAGTSLIRTGQAREIANRPVSTNVTVRHRIVA